MRKFKNLIKSIWCKTRILRSILLWSSALLLWIELFVLCYWLGGSLSLPGGGSTSDSTNDLRYRWEEMDDCGQCCTSQVLEFITQVSWPSFKVDTVEYIENTMYGINVETTYEITLEKPLSQKQMRQLINHASFSSDSLHVDSVHHVHSIHDNDSLPYTHGVFYGATELIYNLADDGNISDDDYRYGVRPTHNCVFVSFIIDRSRRFVKVSSDVAPFGRLSIMTLIAYFQELEEKLGKRAVNDIKE